MGEVRACVPTHGIMRKEKAFLMNNLYTFAYMRKDLNGSLAFFHRDQVYDLIIYDRDLGSCAFFI